MNIWNHPLAAQIVRPLPGETLSPAVVKRNERYKEVIRKCISSSYDEHAADQNLKQLARKRLKDKTTTKSITMRNHTWITLSLPILKPDFEDLGLTSAKYNDLTYRIIHCNLSYMKPDETRPNEVSYFNIEFYGKDKQLHPHVHIYTPHVLGKARIIRDFHRYFKLPKNFIDVKDGFSAARETRLHYLWGDKQESKLEQVDLDKQMRENLGLNDVYEIDYLTRDNTPSPASHSWYAWNDNITFDGKPLP